MKHIFAGYREWRDKMGFSQNQIMWMHTLVLSVYIYVVIAVYTGGVKGLLVSRAVNISVGYTAMVLILLSMAMSSICYFWDFADRYLGYRKYFGIAGFIYAAVHVLISLTSIQIRIGIPVFLQDHTNFLAFSYGLASFLLLGFLTVISHRLGIRIMGKWWRRFLRFGYLAVVLAVVHTAYKTGGEWWKWMWGETDYILPKFGLILFVGTIAVLILRLAMFYEIMTNKKKTPIKKFQEKGSVPAAGSSDSAVMPDASNMAAVHATPLKKTAPGNTMSAAASLSK